MSGINVMTLCGAKTFYMVDAKSYTGKVEKEASESIPACCVRKLSEYIHETKTNVTVDFRLHQFHWPTTY
jgi:hypothetical protein